MFILDDLSFLNVKNFEMLRLTHLARTRKTLVLFQPTIRNYTQTSSVSTQPQIQTLTQPQIQTPTQTLISKLTTLSEAERFALLFDEIEKINQKLSSDHTVKINLEEKSPVNPQKYTGHDLAQDIFWWGAAGTVVYIAFMVIVQ